MTYAGGVLFLVSLVVTVYCVLDVLRTPAEAVRVLPKLAWLAIVLFFGLVGSAAWWFGGRPKAGGPGGSGGKARPRRPKLPRLPEPGGSPAGAPDDDDAFLRQLRERAEEQRRRARDPRDD